MAATMGREVIFNLSERDATQSSSKPLRSTGVTSGMEHTRCGKTACGIIGNKIAWVYLCSFIVDKDLDVNEGAFFDSPLLRR